MEAIRKDAFAVLDEPVLYKNLSKAWNYFGLDLETALSEFGKPERGNFLHSKLVAISDKACKTRIVAIGDYFTQVALSFVHDKCFKILRKLPFDGTFNHRCMADSLRKSNHSFYDSCDLKTATDRFPILLQSLVVERIFPNLSGPWTNIAIDRFFSTPQGPIRYEAGQPMGFLSSWPVFALTHHVLALTASHLAYPNRTRPRAHHVIVGDDIVLTDRKTSLVYKRLLRTMKVKFTEPEFSSSKSFEFCKRIVKSSRDVSPVSRNVGSSDIVVCRSELELEGLRPSNRKLGRMRWSHRHWKVFLYTPDSPFGNKWGIDSVKFSKLRGFCKETSLQHWIKKVLPRTKAKIPERFSDHWFISQCLEWQRDWIREAGIYRDLSQKELHKRSDLYSKLWTRCIPFDRYINGVNTLSRSKILSKYLFTLDMYKHRNENLEKS